MELEPLLPSTRRWRWIVLGVLAVALAVRVGVVIDDRGTYQPLSDAEHFDQIATQIANGGAWGAPLPPATGPSAVRAPGYPAFLAAIYLVAGDHSYTAARLGNAVVGVGVVALIGLIAAQLFGRRVGFVALAIAALHPALVLVGSGLQLEPLLTLLCLGGVAAALQHRRAPRGLRWPVVAGACLGLAALTRELGLLFVPPLAWILWQARPADLGRWARKALLAPVSMIVVTVLLLVPWTVRNYLRLDAVVPAVTTSAGFGLVGTYNQTAADNRAQWVRPYDDPHLVPILLDLFERGADEIEVNEVLTDETIEFIKDNPGYVPQVAFWNTIRLFDLDGGAYSRFIARFLPYPQWLTNLGVLGGYLVLALAIVGVVARRYNRRAPWAIWVIPLIIYVFMVVTLPASIRYRASMEPFFILAAAGALVAMYDRWLELTDGPAPAVAGPAPAPAPDPEPAPGAVAPAEPSNGAAEPAAAEPAAAEPDVGAGPEPDAAAEPGAVEPAAPARKVALKKRAAAPAGTTAPATKRAATKQAATKTAATKTAATKTAATKTAATKTAAAKKAAAKKAAAKKSTSARKVAATKGAATKAPAKKAGAKKAQAATRR